MSLFKRTGKLSQHEYQEAIDKGLGDAFADAKAREEEIEAPRLKAVVMSDLHRGARDKADDFQRCERAYSAALGWYLEQDYELWLLGDVEELWENGIEEVLPRYEALLDLEREFHRNGRLRRFYGNHDLDWCRPELVEKHLHRWLPGIEPREALRLRVVEDGRQLGLLFLAHGHQGTSSSDRWAWLSRIAVRVGWRAIQRSQGWLATTPADSHELRHKHDLAMYDWARRQAEERPAAERPVLIAGHTHHPVFPGQPPKHPTAADEAALRARLDAERDKARRSELKAELEMMRAVLREAYTPPTEGRPCYFNSGCCSFPDRDVTCLEIDGEALVDTGLTDDRDGRGKIRLMRWLDDQGEPRPKQLAASPLRDVLASVSADA